MKGSTKIREALLKLKNAIKRVINVTLKSLSDLFKVFTKAGKVWKNRINWSDIEVLGNLIETYFGTFTFIEAERVDKIWYWTLQDDEGNIFKIKRDQARKNKRMPKNAQIISIEEPEEKIVVPTITYQLCLPAPKELIDILVEELNHKIKIRILQDNKNYNLFEDFLRKGLIKNTFAGKIDFILRHRIPFNINMKSFFRKLLQYYHPDHSNRDTSEEVEIIMNYKKIWCK